MTDDTLRTRIAQALWDFACPYDLKADHPKPGKAFYQMADAVIRELGLHEEWEAIWDGCGPLTKQPVETREEAEAKRRGRSDVHLEHRYVTEWATDGVNQGT